MNRAWYEELFENSARSYDQEPFVQGTMGEVDFIEAEMGYDRSCRILDVGCGTGRHSIELAKRRYQVVGIDLSAGQLAAARAKAAVAGVEVDFRVGDARKLSFPQQFDLALMLCEGAFALMDTDEEDFAILQGISQALKPGGKLILTTLNVLYLLTHPREEHHAFDLTTFRDRYAMEGVDDEGHLKKLDVCERYYAPSELTWRLQSLGFATVNIFGCRLGAYSRQQVLTTNDFEMLVVAQKASASAE